MASGPARRSGSLRTVFAILGIALATGLLPGAAWLLFWNEGRTLQTTRALADGASVVSVGAERPDPANDGSLVHVTATARFPDALTDTDTGVGAAGVAVLERSVEMFQWQETSTTSGNRGNRTTSYSYRGVWSGSPIDSGGFQRPEAHANPAFPIGWRRFVATAGQLGGFAIGPAELQLLSADEPMQPAAAAAVVAGRPAWITAEGALYAGQDSASPAIGDLRITYRVARPAQLSVIARQAGGGFVGRDEMDLRLVLPGSSSAAEMIARAESENTLVSWVLRPLGLLGILAGFRLLLRRWGPAGILTLALAPPLVAAAWLPYRPYWAGVILGAGLVMAFAAWRWRRP